ncbi:MAG: excinuclease ABC subunit UvrA [Cytophagaceae bacterium]|nr:excinuclease ABC subunit UvrA [Cytophagaceae bacterium]MDW8456096.1 excinuclease ABC subunit UvrA [Cytophagaceae bacterium]
MNQAAHSKTYEVENLNPREYIIIKNARVHNLKNLSVAIPRNKLVVITGVSGSGKSSLAFDTLFAEGQRMYVESLNSYARQFLGRMQKPDVDYIKGVSPAIAVEQKVTSKNPRSTVGTTTEIYDYLKLLYARIGKTYSPISGKQVKKDSVSDVVDFINSFEHNDKVIISVNLQTRSDRAITDELNLLLQKGFTRVLQDDKILFIEDLLKTPQQTNAMQGIQILIDRAIINKETPEEFQHRIADSVSTAFFEGHGECIVNIIGKEIRSFSDKFEADGIRFEEPSVNFFSFNNPYGACKRCEGFGNILGIDEDLVIPNKNLSVYEGAIAPWRGEKMSEWLKPLLKNGIKFDFPIHRPYKELSDSERKILWTGNAYFKGLNDFFSYIETQTHKVQYRVLLSRYKGRTICPECKGTRLRSDASYVKINNVSIVDVVLMPVEKAFEFFKELSLTEYEQNIAGRILTEITNRLEYLIKTGLGYLTLNRLTSTLSGGEYQRIKLATSLGSALVGSMYILDEPSIGLHPRDTQKLIEILKLLRNKGNTVIVVEHEEEIMRAADQIIDIGPDAGANGGELMFQLNNNGVMNQPNFVYTHPKYPIENSHTLRFLNGSDCIPVPAKRRKPIHAIEIKGAREHNLKEIDVRFPLGVLTVVTGVSGSGKSTLVKKVLAPALSKALEINTDLFCKYDSIEGDVHKITRVEFIDQNPIGKSSRSNPVTYVKAYDAIRELFAEQPMAKARHYKASHFSFNIDGGRCELCQGEGEIVIEMQFMADVHLPCEGCGGKRFKQEILDVKYNDKNIYEVLNMTVEESMLFFGDRPKITEKLKPLHDVGLGYVRLGQPSSTLSGGEAQRVKLASFLNKKPESAREHILFIFDEPTTGLHFHDIKKLLTSINALIDQGHSAIIIEHNMDVIKCADWVIDLGPEAGERGGYVCFQGRPDELIRLEGNHTAKYLKQKFNLSRAG